MKTLINRNVCGLTLALLSSLVSCSIPASSTSIPTSTLASPTLTPSPTIAPSPTSSSELPTDTPVPNPIPSTRAPRPTPAPTLTADQEQALVLSLLRDNGGCRLPCWWGFTPRETAWQIAETFFASHGKKIQEYNDSRMAIYTVYFDIPQHSSQINQDYYVVNGDTIDVITVRAVPPTHDDELAYGDVQFAQDWKPYMLPQMLAVYGQPPQVFLQTFSDTPTGWLPFNLLLFYPEQGILVSYYGPAEKERETLRVCLYQADVRLWLWSPEDLMALERIVNMGSSPIGDVSGFRSLEEATGMSIEQFYQTFVQPNNQTCLETPAGMW